MRILQIASRMVTLTPSIHEHLDSDFRSLDAELSHSKVRRTAALNLLERIGDTLADTDSLPASVADIIDVSRTSGSFPALTRPQVVAGSNRRENKRKGIS